MRLFSIAAATLLLSACGGGNDGPAGGPVAGPADTHCGTTAQAISAASCTPTGNGTSDYGNPEYNSEGDDDDCKYHVSFTSTPVRQNTDVTFTVVAREKAANIPATGANVIAEVFLNDKHPAPNSGQHTSEQANGTYAVGPVRFDATGRWTVRFHLHENCADDAPDSPHGHIAFYVDVP